ncbi:MAG: hypothetical protein COB36_02695 [Alphaproteobacteria bacterium]|nr:MAG: hypothetical protein COB36_02695 [Alphaproteobacteria bacterium]
MDDHEFNKILKARAVPPMRSNLEHRIVQASLPVGKNKANSKGNSLSAIFIAILDTLILPKPALSMALVLVFGVMLGGYSSGVSEASTNIDVDAYFLAAETIGYGDIL